MYTFSLYNRYGSVHLRYLSYGINNVLLSLFFIFPKVSESYLVSESVWARNWPNDAFPAVSAPQYLDTNLPTDCIKFEYACLSSLSFFLEWGRDVTWHQRSSTRRWSPRPLKALKQRTCTPSALSSGRSPGGLSLPTRYRYRTTYRLSTFHSDREIGVLLHRERLEKIGTSSVVDPDADPELFAGSGCDKFQFSMTKIA